MGQCILYSHCIFFGIKQNWFENCDSTEKLHKKKLKPSNLTRHSVEALCISSAEYKLFSMHSQCAATLNDAIKFCESFESILHIITTHMPNYQQASSEQNSSSFFRIWTGGTNKRINKMHFTVWWSQQKRTNNRNVDVCNSMAFSTFCFFYRKWIPSFVPFWPFELKCLFLMANERNKTNQRQKNPLTEERL